MGRSSQFSHLGFRVAYDGSSFAGFQRQPHHPSVQLVVEKALSIYFAQKIKIIFTSRTDAGVHAYDQWVIVNDAATLYDQLTLERRQRMLLSLNGLLPDSVRVWDVFKLRSDFHPKKDILWKEYEYRVFNSIVTDPHLEKKTWWIRASLDVKSMQDAVQLLQGKNDFAGFAKSNRKKPKKSSVRTISKIEMRRIPHPFMRRSSTLVFKFRANGFLHHMVRNLVGTLVQIGQGKKYEVKEILTTGDRRLAGVNAPPHALFLVATRVPRHLVKRPLVVRQEAP